MQIPTAVILSSIVSLASGHDTLADHWEWISERMPEVVPGLEAYGVAHHLDLPLPISYDLFKDQIVDTETAEFHQTNIFSTEKVPNWLLFLTLENHSKLKCPNCDNLRPDMQQVAEKL